MAELTRPPRRRGTAAGALVLLVLSIAAASAAATLLLDRERMAGGAAGLAAVLLAAWGSLIATPDDARTSLLIGVCGPLLDAALLAPVAWVARSAAPQDAALALIGLGLSLVSGYERARSASLEFRTRRSAGYRVLRQAVVATGILAGGVWLRPALWVFMTLAGLALVVRAANVVLQVRHGAPERGSA
jgi:hypothetical protein